MYRCQYILAVFYCKLHEICFHYKCILNMIHVFHILHSNFHIYLSFPENAEGEYSLLEETMIKKWSPWRMLPRQLRRSRSRTLWWWRGQASALPVASQTSGTGLVQWGWVGVCVGGRGMGSCTFLASNLQECRKLLKTVQAMFYMTTYMYYMMLMIMPIHKTHKLFICSKLDSI